VGPTGWSAEVADSSEDPTCRLLAIVGNRRRGCHIPPQRTSGRFGIGWTRAFVHQTMRVTTHSIGLISTADTVAFNPRVWPNTVPHRILAKFASDTSYNRKLQNPVSAIRVVMYFCSLVTVDYHRAMLRRTRLCQSMSSARSTDCLSVRPSVIFRYRYHIRWDTSQIILQGRIAYGSCSGWPPHRRSGVVRTETCNISETVQYRAKATIIHRFIHYSGRYKT